MSKPEFDPERHIDAMAPAMGLTITAAQRPQVLEFLAVAARMAALVGTAPISDASFELAPVFRPGDAPGGDAV